MIPDQADIANPDCWTLDEYIKRSDHSALRRVLSENTSQIDVTDQAKTSGLRGRGGASFLTDSKWSFIPCSFPGEKYVVCSTDGGRPGTFKDRDVIMFNLHTLIEGIIIAGYVMSTKASYNYIHDEVFEGYQRFKAALVQARAAGFLDKNILGSGFELELFAHHDYGTYICGEETTLLGSLEGKKDQPRFKPPFPTSFGLYGKPATINNTETLASVSFIIRGGGQTFTDKGIPNAGGTKLFCISGRVERPGSCEVPLGTPFAETLKMMGGMRDDKRLKVIIPSGSSASVLPADIMMQTNMDYDSIFRVGSMLGSDATIVMNEDVCIVKVPEQLNYFYHDESCGQCTPCREGIGWLHRIIHRIVEGKGHVGDLDLLDSVGSQMAGRTICALVDAAVSPVRSFTEHLREEPVHYIEHGGPMKPNKWY